MKELKIKILNEDHSRKVQECLFSLGYTWDTGGTEIRQPDYNCNIIAARKCGNMWFSHENHSRDKCLTKTTLEELQKMVREKGEADILNRNEPMARATEVRDIISIKNKEFKVDDKVWHTLYGHGRIDSETTIHSNVCYGQCECAVNKDGTSNKPDVLCKVLFHSPQEASEYLAAVKDVARFIVGEECFDSKQGAGVIVAAEHGRGGVWAKNRHNDTYVYKDDGRLTDYDLHPTLFRSVGELIKYFENIAQEG